MRPDYPWLLRQWCNDGMITGIERPLLVRDLMTVADYIERVSASSEPLRHQTVPGRVMLTVNQPRTTASSNLRTD